MKKPKNSKQGTRGQALSEYLILTALIGVASISVVQMLSKNLRAKMSQVSEAIRGHKNLTTEKKRKTGITKVTTSAISTAE